jgi:hypothetical protein
VERLVAKLLFQLTALRDVAQVHQYAAHVLVVDEVLRDRMEHPP